MKAALLVAGLACPAFAGDFVAPQGCGTWLTVQQRNCRVSNYYRCDAAPGEQWRAVYAEDGPTYLGHIDHEAQWLDSLTLRDGVLERLEPGGADLASFSALVREGRDDFDFVMTSDDGSRIRYRGHDRLTGVTVTIDGVALRQTEFEIEEITPDGTVTAHETGNQFIHEGWRRFFGGTSTRESGGQVSRADASPVQFILPGEAGFAATVPLIGCGAVMSSLLPPGVIHVRD